MPICMFNTLFILIYIYEHIFMSIINYVYIYSIKILEIISYIMFLVTTSHGIQ